jgi:hypothetical protein
VRLISLIGLCVVLLCVPIEVRAEVSIDEVRKAVVHLDGGSGVCVSPDGFVVTAAHMLPGWPFISQQGPKATKRPGLFQRSPVATITPRSRVPSTVAVRFGDGPKLLAKVLAVRDRDMKSDCAILKLDGENYPFRPMAGIAPTAGQAVHAAGWPGGNWAWYESHVTRVGESPFMADGVLSMLDMTDCSHASAPGASGGPLFNTQLEVIGVCSRGAVLPVQSTLFTRWEHITACLAESGYSPLSNAIARGGDQLVLQVWTTKKCVPCLKFKADMAAGIDCNGSPLQQVFRVEFYDFDAQPAMGQSLGVQVVPTFVTGDGELIAGYEGPQWLVRKLCRYQFPVPNPIAQPAGLPLEPPPSGPPNNPATGPPPAGPVSNTPLPAAPGAEGDNPDQAPIDTAQLRLVVLIEKHDNATWNSGLKGWIGGMVLSRVEGGLEKRMPSLLADKLGDKVQVNICFQRKTPQRFDELVKAAGAPEAKITVVVLVQKRFEGLKAKLSQFVEQKLQDFGAIGNTTAKVLFVFERTDADVYGEVLTALNVTEDSSNETLAAAAVAGTAAGGMTGWFRRRRRIVPETAV